jgi:transposase
MLEAIIHEQGDPETMARLAKGKLREKRDLLEQALSGRVRPHHRFLLVEHLVHLDFLDEQIALVSDEIDRQSRDTDSTNEETLSLLDTIPGVGRPLAQTIMAEIGNQVSSFPSAKHLAAWAGLAPGNNESAGKRRPGPIGHGDTWLRTGLVQAAQAASKMRQCYLAAQYHRIAARRGAKRAIIAVAHSIITIIWHMLTKRQPYRDLGPDYLDNRNKERNVNRLMRRLEKLGFRVSLEPVTAPATP